MANIEANDLINRNNYIAKHKEPLQIALHKWALENQMNDRFKVRYMLYKGLMEADKFVFTDSLSDSFFKDLDDYVLKGDILYRQMIDREKD
jgi:hypothetical protein